MKRYNLVLPEDLYEELKDLADKRSTTVVDLLRRFIKLGLVVAKVDATPDSQFIIREHGKERQVLLF